MKKFKIVCNKCGKSNVKFELTHDHGCNDPECCGGRNYSGFRVICKCREKEDIPCDEED